MCIFCPRGLVVERNLGKVEAVSSILTVGTIFASLCSFVLAGLFCFPSSAKIYINIGAPQKTEKSLIALSNFVFKGSNPKDAVLGQKMKQRFEKNLKFSSYFELLPPRAFIRDPSKLVPLPYHQDIRGFRYNNWRLVGADFLFFASYSINQDLAELTLDVSLYDISAQKALLKRQYKAVRGKSLELVDKLSDDIVYRLSGKRGIFQTKILAVAGTGGSKKELFKMDWDGRNSQRLTYHQSIVLSPVWSPDGKGAIYSAFVYSKKLKKRALSLFQYDFAGRKVRLLSAKEGGALAGDFFPDGKNLLLASANIGKRKKGGVGFSLFRMNLKWGFFRPLPGFATSGKVISVEPDIHPKTGEIAFSSDMRGKTMIYKLDSSGKVLNQLTFAGNHNAEPAWHPERRQLVFSGMSKGRMDLFKLDLEEGGTIRRLTSLRKNNGQWANCESPDFSPNGRFVVFVSDLSGFYQLYTLNLEDLSVERLTFDQRNYRFPRWSPYLSQ